MISMWSEKYRPTALDDCVLSHIDEAEVRFIKNSSLSERLPNMLFYGPPGTGKTTIARVLCDDEKYTVNQYNGSIVVKEIAEKIGKMLQTRSLFHAYRCILIDEVDGMSLDAQKALRAMIEANVETVSWIFTANSISKIIEPLRSRLAMIYCSIPALDKRQKYFETIVARCETILRHENISEYDINDVRHIVEQNLSDIRQTLNRLQMRYEMLQVA